MIILTGVKCWWAKLIAITVTGDHSNPFERLPHDVRAGRIMMHMSVLLDLLLRQRVLFLSIEVEDNVSMKVRVHEKPSSHRHLTGIPEIVCRHCRTSGSPRQDAVWAWRVWQNVRNGHWLLVVQFAVVVDAVDVFMARNLNYLISWDSFII